MKKKSRKESEEELLRITMGGQLDKHREELFVSRQRYQNASAPIMDDLARLGYRLDSLQDLYKSGTDYRSAIPVLVKWLPAVQDKRVKETIARALTTKHAKPVALPVLIEEFVKTPNEMASYKWALGNALDVVADDRFSRELVKLALEKTHGKARQMLVSGLRHLKTEEAKNALIRLLDDEEVAIHAVYALGSMKAREARPKLQNLSSHPNVHLRKEAIKALKKLDA